MSDDDKKPKALTIPVVTPYDKMPASKKVAYLKRVYMNGFWHGVGASKVKP